MIGEQYECPGCKWQISKLAIDAMTNDWLCPSCRKFKYSEFVEKVKL